jgi:hypothetical protein
MIQVSIGDPDEFNALVYGVQKHPGTVSYLENQLNRLSTWSNTLTEAGKSFFSNAAQLIEQFNGSDAMRLARAALRKAGSLFQSNEIRSIWDLAELQHAPVIMQRYIMAEPTVRELFNQQRCDGYSETYVDMYPGTIGENHYDYRRVMTGMVQTVTVDDDPDVDWVCRTFIDDLVEGDRELLLEEKTDILNTWDMVASLIKEGGEDPTSPFANKL